VTPCGSCKTRHFGASYHFHHQDGKNQELQLKLLFSGSVLQLVVTANFVPSSLILFILMLEPILPPKRRLLQESGGVTSQNTAFFIVTALKTSNLTRH
jgi:hypothetical protein